jgi:CRISPR type I-E-associated protein CasB/Cse2
MTITAPPTAPPATTGSTVGATSLAWWQQHCHPTDGDPATRARLRRARSGLDVLAIPAAVVLARRLGMARSPERATKALELARILAHVRASTDRSPMHAAGWQRFPYDPGAEAAAEQRPRLSETRFRRLIRAERDEGELTSAFIRLVTLLDGEVSVPRLSEAFWYWDVGDERVRRRWAFEYYAAGIAAPSIGTIDAAVPIPNEDSEA